MTPTLHEYLPMHADQLMKLAIAPKPAPAPKAPHQGKMQKYMPWYGAASLGAAGHEIAKRVLPKKFKAVGAIAGTLAGTALGVHGGEALGKKLDRPKTAAASKKEPKKKPESPTLRMGKLIGAGAGGMALGTAAGYGAGRGAEALAKRMGRPISAPGVLRYGIPLAGAGMGTAYSLWKAHEAEQMRRAIQSSRDQP